MGSRRINSEDTARYGRVIWNFFDKSQKYAAVKAKFDAIKSDFEAEMESLFSGSKYRSMTVTKHGANSSEPSAVKVTKVERTTIRWDIDKLRARIPKDVFKKVIKKEYRIVGMPQLVKYLKSCGVDPEVFKQFVVVDESVDQDAIDRMGELGHISAKQISGCYIVDCSKPYFKVSLVKTKDDGE